MNTKPGEKPKIPLISFHTPCTLSPRFIPRLVPTHASRVYIYMPSPHSPLLSHRNHGRERRRRRQDRPRRRHEARGLPPRGVQPPARPPPPRRRLRGRLRESYRIHVDHAEE